MVGIRVNRATGGCNQSLEIQMPMAWQKCWCTITKEANGKAFPNGSPDMGLEEKRQRSKPKTSRR